MRIYLIKETTVYEIDFDFISGFVIESRRESSFINYFNSFENTTIVSKIE